MSVDMTEPASTSIAGFFGIKIGTIVAHVLGNTVALSFMAPMHVVYKVLSVLGGMTVSWYATAIALHFWPSLQAVEAETAFFAGLFGMAFVKSVLDEVPETVRRVLDKVRL
jgi:hypothetical protein